MRKAKVVKMPMTSHWVRLGYFHESEGKPAVVIGDRADGVKKTLKITPQHYDLLKSLDVTMYDQPFTKQEDAMLLIFARAGIVEIVDESGNFDDFTAIPVSRNPIKYVEEYDQGYLVQAGNAEAFQLTEIGSRIANRVDGSKPLSAILEEVKVDVLSDLDNRIAMENEAINAGVTVDDFFKMEAFQFMKQMMTSHAMTFEPA